MKFVRFGSSGSEVPGVLVDGRLIDISSLVEDLGPASMESLPQLVDRIGDASGIPVLGDESVRLGAPVARPFKILAVGLNYEDHAAESGSAVPDEPVVFSKATSSVSGPYDDLLLPPGAEKVDWEVELGLVIGGTARYLEDEASANAVIAGYLLGHDVSERSFQLERGGQWMKGKSADTFTPLGPWLVTPDEFDDVLDLELTCWVNGEEKQSGSTSTMVFSPDYIVWHLSQFLTLEPGDVILTGTPPGIGMPRGTYLREGDVVELAATGLGVQRQVCRRREIPASGLS